MGENICLVFGASPEKRRSYIRGYLKKVKNPAVITADGGLDVALAMGLIPCLHIGDDDSRRAEIPGGVKSERLSAKKDSSDMKVCLERGLEMGYREFWIFGATGGRLDHFLANVFLLEYLHMRGASGILIDSDNEICYHPGGTFSVPYSNEFKYISILAIDMTVSGVTLKGVEYPLEDATLIRANPIGLSNCPSGRVAAQFSTVTGQSLIVRSERAKKRYRKG